jgi:uncharacterized protein (TIGR02996 family)
MPPPGYEPFLKTILDDPGADSPRLVYADWLEEHGDPRAEFIRVQCELARLPEDAPRRDLLGDRRDQLLRAHRETWWAEIPEWARPHCEFTRGFVSEVTVFGPWRRSYGPELSRLAPVEKVSLQNFHEATNEFTDNPGVRHLAELAILDEHMTDDSLKDLLNSTAAMTPLRALYFLDMRETADGEGRINGDAAANMLSISRHLGRLGRLEMIHCGLHNAGVVRLVRAESMRNLKWINISQNNLTDVSVWAIASADTMRGLTHLGLTDNQITNDGMQYIIDSHQLNNLTHLELAGNVFGDRVIPALIERFPDLAHLSISRKFLSVSSQLALHGHYGKRVQLLDSI